MAGEEVKATGKFQGALKKMGSAVTGTGGFGFAFDLATNVAAGDNLGTSAAKAGLSGIMATANPLLWTSMTMAPLAKDAFIGYKRFEHEKQTWWNKQFMYDNKIGGNFQDTQRAQTMRQAAVQSIQASKMNARSALGGEAKILNPYASRRY